jgi:flagellar basal-body rod protein FlgB
MGLIDDTQSVLESAMHGAQLRQSLLTNNIANVDTPGYQRQDVDFQSQLRAALDAGSAPTGVTFQPTITAQALRADGNGVDLSTEATKLSENGLTYEALTQVDNARVSILRQAIGGSAGAL